MHFGYDATSDEKLFYLGLKPVFHQVFCGVVVAGNPIYFALGTFQNLFSQIRI